MTGIALYFAFVYPQTHHEERLVSTEYDMEKVIFHHYRKEEYWFQWEEIPLNRLLKGYKDFEKTLELTGVMHRIGVKTQEEFKKDAERVFVQYPKYCEAHPGSTSPKPEGDCMICPDCQGKGLRLKKLPLLKVDVGKVCKTCGGSGYLPTHLSDFAEIPVENIIKESRTENSNYCEKQYIVYISPGDSRKKIRVNTYYLPQGEKVRLCTHYDRGLCDTLEEYNKLPIEYIEE